MSVVTLHDRRFGSNAPNSAVPEEAATEQSEPAV